MARDPVLNVAPLGFPWRTLDPFLICAHQEDGYPAGDARMAPAASLAGRPLGNDFEGRDGWRMYHGQVVPGFPRHPHRGFETITIIRKGTIDHADSLGASSRFGAGDVEWITAGRGVAHAEMFPLLDRSAPNPLEMFQIWLNLPRANKLVAPHFSMLWRDAIPVETSRDPEGRSTEITVVAGSLRGLQAPPPPPSSWAAAPESDLAIWTIRMDPGAHAMLPPAASGSRRTLYFFRGNSLQVGDRAIPSRSAVEITSGEEIPLANGPEPAELLLLQGRPIGEPIAQQGPFVMTTPDEIREAFADYRRTQFGGWPWPSDAPVHGRDERRFARYPDGRVERGR